MSHQKALPLLIASLPLLLTACGGGWETRPYTGVPYDGERTAGTGIEYVLGHMAPARGADLTPAAAPKVEPAPISAPKVEGAPAPKVETPAPPVATPATPPVQSSDKLFNDKQRR